VSVEPVGDAIDAAGQEPYRVMLVDDSAVIRGLLAKWLETDPAVKVIATACDGAAAVDTIGRAAPEIVVLDIEMPRMDGLTALPKLLEFDPSLQVVMASTLTRQNASVSLRAMSMGAADYIPKPTSRQELHGGVDFRSELLRKVKALGAVRRARENPQPQPARARRVGLATARPQVDATVAGGISLRKPGILVPEAVAIGSSTGGPQALFKVFEHLKNTVQLPIFITQHMPPMFTTILAENIMKVSGADCAEGVDGEIVRPGRVYLAPGDYHMLVTPGPGGKMIRLNQDPPEHFCRPAVDPMMRSIVGSYGGKVLGVILTGMGSDGLVGGEMLAEAGGTLIAQDEESSVVWGMPGAVARQGVCSSVLPIDQIGPTISRIITGGRS
jgi:two-component system chemotaxis response regulator CheB